MSGQTIYGYVGGNPVSLIDPFGLAKCGPGATPVTGTNYSVRVDPGQPNTDQQSHAHIYDKNAKEIAVVNKDGTGSHGCNVEKDVPKNKKLQEHLGRKLLNKIPVFGLAAVCYDLAADPTYSLGDAIGDQVWFLSSTEAH